MHSPEEEQEEYRITSKGRQYLLLSELDNIKQRLQSPESYNEALLDAANFFARTAVYLGAPPTVGISMGMVFTEGVEIDKQVSSQSPE